MLIKNGNTVYQQHYGHMLYVWPITFIKLSPLKQHIDYLTPIQVATGTKVEINQKHFKPFGCPVCVLNKSLQLGQPHGKWKERSKVGVYLGPSPMHNRNVALVLDLDTGLVIPQFHVLYDT